MRLIFLPLLLIVLSGCTKTVYVDRVEYLYPDDSWTIQVEVASPPDRDRFMEAVMEKKLQMLGEAYSQQTQNLYMCNARLRTIDVWKVNSSGKVK
jgi:hypothetical protein